jgi:hypothetical protein
MNNPKFDGTINLRTMLLGAFAGWLASSKFKIPSEVTTLVSAIAASLYDIGAYYIKQKFTGAK